MSIKYTCEKCGRHGQVKDEMAGKIGSCPNTKCRAPIEIPGIDWAKFEKLTNEPAVEQPPAKPVVEVEVKKVPLWFYALPWLAAVICMFSLTFPLPEALKVIAVIGVFLGIGWGISMLKTRQSSRTKVKQRIIPKTELEALQSIDKQMEMIRYDVLKLRDNVGCMYVILVLLVILSVIVALVQPGQ